MTRIATFAAAVALGAALYGCAIDELQRGNAAAQASIDEKERQLADEQQVQRTLAAQRDQLLADLKKSETNASRLKAQLDQMSRINDTAPVRTPRQRLLHDQRAQQLTDASKQAQALERDSTLSQKEKTKQLDALKEKTRKMLELLLQG